MAELIDLVGKKFGKLTVLSFNKKEKGHYYWNCICDCGKECVKDGDRLRRLKTNSCGCYRIDRAKFDRLRVELNKELMAIRKRIYR